MIKLWIIKTDVDPTTGEPAITNTAQFNLPKLEVATSKGVFTNDQNSKYFGLNSNLGFKVRVQFRVQFSLAPPSPLLGSIIQPRIIAPCAPLPLLATLGQGPASELGVWAESALPVGEIASWKVLLQSFWLAKLW